MAFKILDKFKQKMVQYVYSYQYGKPLWRTQKDEQYIIEAYNKVVWVYSCVSFIGSCVGGVPWLLYRKGRGGNLIEINEHPILDMVNKKINPHFSSKDFFDLWATYLALNGKFYAQYNNSTLPTQLHVLYPHRVSPIPHRKQFISGFEHKIGEDKTILKPQQVLWTKFNDPLDLYQGLSPIKALARTIDTENEAVDWNKKSLENGAVPIGAINVANPSPDLRETLRKDWIERYGGKSNVRIPLILNSEKSSYTNFGLSPLDMDFLEQRKMNRIEVCTAFGVPSQLVGDPQGQQYANFNEALKSFWENTVIPRYLDLMKDALNRDLVNRYADNLFLDYDLNDVQVLHESLDSIAERTSNLFTNNIISLNEARLSLGYEKWEDGDKLYFDFLTQTPIKPTGDETDDDTDDETDDDKSVSLTSNKSIDLTDEEKEMFWKSFDNARINFEIYLENKVAKFFKDEFKQIEKLDVDKDKLVNEIEKIIDKNKSKWSTLIYAFWVAVVKKFGDLTWEDLHKQKSMKAEGFNVYASSVVAYTRRVTAEKVKQITDTSKVTIKNAVLKGIDDGEDIRGIRDNIQESYDAFSTNRATTIARTETIGASNYGSVASAKQSELDIEKIWIRTFDKNVRDTHIIAGSHKPIPLDEKFIVGGSELEYPADPFGEAKEVVNCRCTLGYKSK